MLWLGLAAIVLAVSATVVVVALGLHAHNHGGVADSFWQELVRTIDPGQITEDKAGYAAVSLVVTILGLLLVSTLISVVNNRIERRVEGVRRGRDAIRVDGHIVILGWSDIAEKVIEEIAKASPKPPPQDVAVLACGDVQEMRHQLAENEDLGRLARHWPVLRSGTTSDPRDLRRLASVQTASSVVVLHDDEEEGSAETVKTVMAVVAACESPDHTAEPAGRPTIVVEVDDDPDGTISHLKRRLRRFGFRLLPVEAVELRNELAAQVTRRAGLSAVFHDLLAFDGSELYLATPPNPGTTFGEAVVGLEDMIPIGLLHPGPPPQVDLWPLWDQVIGEAQMIVLAEDANVVATARSSVVTPSPLSTIRPSCSTRSLEKQRLLIIGWNAGAAHLVEILDQYTAPGSTLTIATDHATTIEPGRNYDNLEVEPVLVPDGGLQRWLDRELDHFDHAVVLSDDEATPAGSDAKTLVTLLALRPPGPSHGNPATVVAQLRERSNKHLARQSLADDLVVGGALTATVIAQVAVRPDIEPALRELVGETPSTLDLVDVRSFDLTEVRTFADLTRTVAEGGEIALGWQTEGKPCLCPSKSEELPPDASFVVVLTRVAEGSTPRRSRPTPVLLDSR